MAADGVNCLAVGMNSQLSVIKTGLVHPFEAGAGRELGAGIPNGSWKCLWGSSRGGNGGSRRSFGGFWFEVGLGADGMGENSLPVDVDELKGLSHPIPRSHPVIPSCPKGTEGCWLCPGSQIPAESPSFPAPCLCFPALGASDASRAQGWEQEQPGVPRAFP